MHLPRYPRTRTPLLPLTYSTNGNVVPSFFFSRKEKRSKKEKGKG
jgi:hypothetical protein